MQHMVSLTPTIGVAARISIAKCIVKFNACSPEEHRAQQGETQAGAGIAARGCQRLISIGSYRCDSRPM